jgi:hypothetical protein
MQPSPIADTRRPWLPSRRMGNGGSAIAGSLAARLVGLRGQSPWLQHPRGEATGDLMPRAAPLQLSVAAETALDDNRAQCPSNRDVEVPMLPVTEFQPTRPSPPRRAISNTRLGSWGGPTKHPGGLLPRRVPLFLQRACSWISVELHSDFRMATGTVREVRGTTMNANHGHHSGENRLKILVEPRERLRGPIRRV